MHRFFADAGLASRSCATIRRRRRPRPGPGAPEAAAAAFGRKPPDRTVGCPRTWSHWRDRPAARRPGRGEAAAASPKTCAIAAYGALSSPSRRRLTLKNVRAARPCHRPHRGRRRPRRRRTAEGRKLQVARRRCRRSRTRTRSMPPIWSACRRRRGGRGDPGEVVAVQEFRRRRPRTRGAQTPQHRCCCRSATTWWVEIAGDRLIVDASKLGRGAVPGAAPCP